MLTFPTAAERGENDAVLIRTDYTDESRWRAARAAFERGDTTGRADGGGPSAWTYVIVDDPAWHGAGVDEAIAAADGDDYLDVVFLADAITLAGPEHLFLAVALPGDLDPDDYAEITAHGREFRIVPAEIPGFHANLDIGNMDFEEFASVAQETGSGTFRGFAD